MYIFSVVFAVFNTPGEPSDLSSQVTSRPDQQYKVGDKITFGSYPFYEDGRKKDIEWIILDIDADNNALVISGYALDRVKYNEKYEDVTWKKSTIREWLNKDFLNNAFTDEEQSNIIESRIENKDNAEHNTKGGEATYDKLFLLSIDEATNNHFDSPESRRAHPTPYAESRNSVNGISSYVWWWLRSPGTSQNKAAIVRDSGGINSSGSDVNSKYGAVRPAFRINLKNLHDKGSNSKEKAKVATATTGLEEENASLKAQLEDAKKEIAELKKLRQDTAKGDVAATQGGQAPQYKVGDIIKFGKWPVGVQGETSQPIEWEILEKDNDGTAIVLSSKIIDAKPYNTEQKDITWVESSLRRWLNGDFYSKAFTAAEKDAIVEARLKNADNEVEITQEYVDWGDKWGLSWYRNNKGTKWHTKGGEETNDKVWLLSLEDMNRYGRRFSNDASRISRPTEYLKKKVQYCKSDKCKELGFVGNTWWWLRSPGRNQNRTAIVNYGGFVSASGDYVGDEHGGVRPAFRINLNKLQKETNKR